MRGSLFYVHATRKIDLDFRNRPPQIVTVESAEQDDLRAVMMSTDTQYSIDVFLADGSGNHLPSPAPATKEEYAKIIGVLQKLAAKSAFADEVSFAITMLEQHHGAS